MQAEAATVKISFTYYSTKCYIYTMKKLLLLLIIIFFVITITVTLIFIPPDDVLSRLPILRSFYSNTILTVTSPNSKANVTINGKDYGKTNQTIKELEEGSYNVTLERISKEQNFYEPQTFSIDLTRNTESIIAVEIGPENIKSGYVLFYTPAKTPRNYGSLSLSTDTPGASIYIDNEFISEAPLTNFQLSSTNHLITISAKGYESIEVPIVINDDHNLNVVAYLIPIPVNLN